MDLSKIATCDLVNELAKREGVKELVIDPYVPYEISMDGVKTTTLDTIGPARILEVID